MYVMEMGLCESSHDEGEFVLLLYISAGAVKKFRITWRKSVDCYSIDS